MEQILDLRKIALWRKMALVLFGASFLYGMYTSNPYVLLLGLLALFALLLIFTKTVAVIYIMALFSFFSGWFIAFYKYDWSNSIPVLRSINAPIGDFIGFFGLVCLFLLVLIPSTKYKSLLEILKKKEVIIYSLFLLASLLAVVFAYDGNTRESFWYFLRSMVFPFVAYFILPQVLVDDQHKIKRVFQVWFFVGIVVAIYGFSSLFVGAQVFNRISPYPFLNGFSPVGLNHNQLAEILTTILPAGALLALSAKNKKLKMMYVAGVMLMTIVALLTLSRAAWLTIFVELVLAMYFYKKEVVEWLKSHQASYFGIVSVFVFVAVYMFAFLGTSIAASSNASRLDVTKIVYFYYLRSPVVGYGPGMFVRLLGDARAYVMDYGDPLEAHGFIQKVMLEEGIIGLFFFGLFLLYFLLKVFNVASQNKKHFYIAMILMASGAVVFQIFNTEYFSPVLWLPLGIVAAAIEIKNAEQL